MLEKVKLEELSDYSITRCGRLFNDTTKRELKFSLNRDGYYVVVLKTNQGKRTCRRRARLLAQTFIPNPYNLPVVNHIDHNRTNDSLENLEWVTHLDNNIKSIELYPEKHRGNADIDELTAHNICKLIENGYNNQHISKTLNVGIDTVKHIRRGNTWKVVSSHYNMIRSTRSVPDDVIVQVCLLILAGHTNRQILDLKLHDKLTISVLKRIRNRETYLKITCNYLGDPEGSEINL